MMKYRADIDGLRAIAILLVLVYHSNISYFPSGFIGVDIFFVISGFLITSIIYQSLSTGHFSFIDFYNRRLWRLQPVFICLLVVTTFLVFVFFLPDDLMQYSKSARKASLFIANLFFEKTTTAYFSPTTHQLPLLHTWSLAIEWQCYLFLPIAMYVLQRIFKRYLPIIVSFLALVFLALSLHYSKILPAHTYYQLSSRIFEFLMGASVALMPLQALQVNKKLLSGIGAIALGTIFYVASQDHILLGYPDWYAFFVCFATAGLISIGAICPNHFWAKLLSLRPMVFLGLLSYSLYLWHWPILAILRYYEMAETPAILTAVYSVIFMVAYLSWRYIEKPARQLKTTPFRYTLLSLILAPALLMHLISFVIKIQDGFPQRFNQELVTIHQELERYANKQRSFCLGNSPENYSECMIGAKTTNARTALLMGDSFANHYWGFLDVLGQNANISILVQGVSSCITLPGIYLYNWWNYKNQIYPECFDQTQKYYQMIQKNHYDYVIIGQIWSNYFSDNIINQVGDERSLALTQQRLTDALDKALAIITDSGAKPVLIETSALMPETFHNCFYKHIKKHQPYKAKECNFTLKLSNADRWFSQLYAKMKIKYPTLIIIDPKQVQCEERQCKAAIHGIPVYRDVGHITDYASYQFGKRYLKRFKNPLV